MKYLENNNLRVSTNTCMLLSNYVYIWYLEVPVHDTVGMAVVDRLQDLLDAVRGVSFRVELSSHNVFKKLTSRDPAKGRHY